MSEIRFSVEQFLTGDSYLKAGGYSGKAVPFEYIEGMITKILDWLHQHEPGYEWEHSPGKWGNEIVGYLKEQEDKSFKIALDIKSFVFNGNDVTLEEAAAWNPPFDESKVDRLCACGDWRSEHQLYDGGTYGACRTGDCCRLHERDEPEFIRCSAFFYYLDMPDAWLRAKGIIRERSST